MTSLTSLTTPTSPTSTPADTPLLRRVLPTLRVELASAATRGRSVTYAEASAAIGGAYLPRGLGRVLDALGRACAERGEPNLASLVVRADQREVGHGYRDAPGGTTSEAAAERRRCWNHWGGPQAEAAGAARESR